MKQSYLLSAAATIIFGLFLCLSLTPSYAQFSNRCTQWRYGTDSQIIPSIYGVPYSLFFTNRAEQPKGTDPPTFVQVDCSMDSDWHRLEDGKMTITETYAVYKYAFEWKDGNWHLIVLTGKPLRGSENWLSRIGRAAIVRTPTELSKNNYVLAYTCEAVENNWMCGCRDVECKTHGWQLQIFSTKTTM
jgi:hypothetical protein